jgi:hypothetical protein
VQGVWNVRESVRGYAIEAELKRLREDWHLEGK